MQCDEYREMLSAYIDNELAALDQAALEDHLWNCVDCRAALDELQAANDSLTARPKTEIPADIEAAVLEQARTTKPKPARKKLFGGTYQIPRPLAWAACLLLLLLAGNSIYLTLNSGGEGQQRQASEPTEPHVQKIVLSQADVVSVRTIVGNENE